MGMPFGDAFGDAICGGVALQGVSVRLLRDLGNVPGGLLFRLGLVWCGCCSVGLAVTWVGLRFWQCLVVIWLGGASAVAVL